MNKRYQQSLEWTITSDVFDLFVKKLRNTDEKSNYGVYHYVFPVGEDARMQCLDSLFERLIFVALWGSRAESAVCGIRNGAVRTRWCACCASGRCAARAGASTAPWRPPRCWTSASSSCCTSTTTCTPPVTGRFGGSSATAAPPTQQRIMPRKRNPLSHFFQDERYNIIEISLCWY